jgi:hypothetical protein
MTTQHFSISHTDETGKTTLVLAALVDGTFHIMRNTIDAETIAKVKETCILLANYSDLIADPDTFHRLGSVTTISRVDADTLLPALLAHLKVAEAKDTETRKALDGLTKGSEAAELALDAAADARLLVGDIKQQIGHLMAPGGKAQVALTIGKETRTISIKTMAGINQPERAYSDDYCGAYQKGPGCKVWEQRIHFWAKNGRWEASPYETILNRPGYQLIGWTDKMPKAAISQHNSAC